MATNPYIYPVPVGATIPAGTEYAVVMDRNHGFTQGGADDYPRFTADPIPAPRPMPPTEPGTVLAEVFDGRDTCAAMIFFSGEWYGVDQDGAPRFWKSGDLVSWTVADVTPRKADPLDESDHRDRIDYAGDILRWFPNGKWEWPEMYPEAKSGGVSLADCTSWTTLRFADEATS